MLAKIQQRANLNQLICLDWYVWPVDRFIRLIKFEQHIGLVSIVSEWFVTHALKHPRVILPDAMISVPSGLKSQWQRGYNVAAMLTQDIEARLQITHLQVMQKRGFSWFTQRGANRETRLSQSMAFHCPELPDYVSHVAIVDDVVTTGTTLIAMANAIRRTNPNVTISGWCMAATP